MRPISLFWLLILGLILSACGGATEPTPVELFLTAQDIAYDVNHLEVMAGQPVKLTLHNAGMLEHDFSIMTMPHLGEIISGEMPMEADHMLEHVGTDMDLHLAAPIGGSNTVTFTPAVPGEYLFYCTVSGHREAGMVGTLVVIAP